MLRRLGFRRLSVRPSPDTSETSITIPQSCWAHIGIKYQRLGHDHYYAQELFEQEELTGYLKNMLAETKKSVY